MTQFISTLVGIFQSSGFARFGEPGGYLYAIMICVGCFLLYLAIVKEFEPLILLPMAFGMILANLPGSGIIHMQYFIGDGLEHPMWVEILNNGGLADMLYMGVKLGIYPPLIFLGIGTMTDFAPLISNPKSLLLGAAAQFGIFGTYMGARLLAATGLVDFTQKQSAAIAIIGGADGPTAIFVTSRLAPELLGSIAVAAYSYMALVPVIQPPIMKALTTKKERTVVMKQLRTVSKTERIVFPIMVTIIVSLIVPDAAVLVGMLMLGNLMKESGVVDRLQKTAGNELMNIITIFLALSVGCTTSANTFLNTRTLFIIVLGLIFGGICTVSEAAAISAFYSAIVGVFIYKTVSIKNLLNTLYETTISVAAIMILVGLSKASAYVVISSQLPQLFMKAMTSLVSSKFVVLLMINVIFLILGCLMEGNCIIVMMVPLMLNLVNSFGIDLIQFGILTCVNIYIGCITPPVGVSLLVGTKLGGASMGGAFKACMPFFLISLVTLLLVSYVPAFSLWLPSLAG